MTAHAILACNRDLARQRAMRPTVAPVPRVCFVTQTLQTGGAQVLTLRWMQRLPGWVRDRAVLWVRDRPAGGGAWPLEQAAKVAGIGVTHEQPEDVTHWVLSAAQGGAEDFAADQTTIVLHSSDPMANDQLYERLYGYHVLGVAAQLERANAAFLADHAHVWGGVLPAVYYHDRRQDRDSGPRDGSIRVLFVGRPTVAKGAQWLPQLVARVSEIRVRAIVPAGSDRVLLGEHVAVEEGLDAVCAYAGQRWFETADVLVLLSLSEGQPLAVGEALAHGVPVVATAVGGIPEVIRPGENGFLLPLDFDLETLAKAVVSAAALNPSPDLSLCGDSWDRTHLPTLLRRVGAELPAPSEADVTVVVEDGPELLGTMASVAGQTYRNFCVCGVGGYQDMRPFMVHVFAERSDALRLVHTRWVVQVKAPVCLERRALERLVAIAEATGCDVGTRSGLALSTPRNGKPLIFDNNWSYGG